jgi:hypothetical protein
MRGRHTDVAEELDDMSEDARDGVHPRSKHGAQKLLPGPSLGITFWTKKKQVTQIDWLATEIRAGAGLWITRSAIVTAIIEAALRSETHGELLEASHIRNLRAPLPEVRRVQRGTRVIRMAKYLLRKRSWHFKREDGF